MDPILATLHALELKLSATVRWHAGKLDLEEDKIDRSLTDMTVAL